MHGYGNDDWAIAMTAQGESSGIELQLARSKQELRRLAAAVEEFASAQSLEPRVANALALALEEAVTNVVFYAFGDPPPDDDSIWLTIECRDGSIHAVVRDRGRPFDPTAREAPSLPDSLDDLEPGGLGIGIIRGIVDRLDYRREDGFNRLDMEIAL